MVNDMNLGKESEQIEFKQSTSELEEALIDIVAILNKHSSGTLYFGVKNNGDVCGMQIGESTARDVSRRIYEKIKPQIYPTITEEVDNEKHYIKVEFDGFSKPYSCDGRYYTRVMDESRELSPSELANFILNVNYKKWEQMCSDNLIEDVDESQLKSFLKKAIESQRMPNIDYDKVGLLSKLGLIYDDGNHLNNAGKMLFSSKKPISMKMAVFATDEKRTFLDINPVEGNIFELIEQAEMYVKKNIKWKVEIKDFERIEIPEIPIEALREIIINSLAHANYISTSKHEIDIHPNKIAIYNPGSFPDGLIPEDFVRSNISSKIRNELICNALYKCKAVETWSTGLRKVFTLCADNNIKIAYEKEYDGFWFFFIRGSSDVTTNVTRNVTTNVTLNKSASDLTELEKSVLLELEKNPKATRDILSSITGRNTRQIQRVLNNLKEKHLITRVGSTKNGYWQINKDII